MKENRLEVEWDDLSTSNWRSLLEPTFQKKGWSIAKYPPELEELALAQRMNTPARKEVFCLLMGSEDYMDAFARLSRLNKQERDITRVLITCCGQEPSYNEFYGLVATQFCLSRNSFKYSFQYALWDSIKQFSDFPIRKVANIAKFFGKLISESVMPLSCIKYFEFPTLTEKQSLFLKVLLEGLLAKLDEKSLFKVFSKLVPEKFNVLREGLKLYIQLAIISHPRTSFIRLLGKEKYNLRIKWVLAALREDN